MANLGHQAELAKVCAQIGHLWTDKLKEDGKTLVRCRRCEITEER